MRKLFALSLALAFFTGTQQGARPELADLILHNGVIWTVDSKNSTAQAIAIKGGKFVVVGSNGLP